MNKLTWELGAATALVVVIGTCVGVGWRDLRRAEERVVASKELFIAIQAVDLQQAAKALDRGANPNLVITANELRMEAAVGEIEETALGLAVRRGAPEIVGLLLTRGARRDLKDKRGDSALAIARRERRGQRLIRLLEEAGVPE